MTAISVRQRWAQIALGMQQDTAAYQVLQQLLHTQFHAALRHDAAGMEDVAQQITQQAQQLEQARQARVAHAQALLPQGAPVSMTALFSQLPAPLQQQMTALWRKLEAQVQACKAMNLRNCELIMAQAQTMRQVIAGGAQQEDIYGPR